MVALCVQSCSVSRQTEVSSSQFQGSRVETRDTVREQVVVAVHDTLTLTKTITIRENEKGDTIRMSMVTDRLVVRDRDKAQKKEEKAVVVRDTVYIEKRDSILVKETGFRGQAPGDKKSGFLTYVKWIFALICAIIGLIITVKVCLRKVL